MALAMDTLGFSKRLRDNGIPQEEAEAYAEAVRDFVMIELVTKQDLLATKQELQTSIDHQTLRLTVRLGLMLVVAVGALATLLKLS